MFAIALLALSVAFMLSPPRMSARAWHQSPVSPISPVTTKLPPKPAPSPTIPAITGMPVSTTLSPLETEPPQSGEGSKAMLVAGGIVLFGLITGAVVLLMRGQPTDEPVS